MASFGVVNATVAAGGRGAVHRAAHVWPGLVKGFSIAGNVLSLVTILVPVLTYVVPVCVSKGVGQTKIWGFFTAFFGSLLWLLYAIPSKHRDMFTMAVNCVGLAIQSVYILVYLKYTIKEDLEYYTHMTLIAGTLTVGVLIFFIPVVMLTHVWSLKVIGIFAATFSTINFAGGVIDVVILVKKQESIFNGLQLAANLGGALVWTCFGFLFRPIVCYTVIPNITGVAVTITQIIFHTILRFKNRRIKAAAAAAAIAAAGNGTEDDAAIDNAVVVAAATTDNAIIIAAAEDNVGTAGKGGDNA